MRDVNATLEPREIAAALLERAASWLPIGTWALVSADPSGQLSLLAQRGRPIEAEEPLFAVARWVMRANDVLFSADLRHETRATGDLAAAVVGFPLTARGTCPAVLVGIDTTPSSREPRLPPAATRRALAVLLEPAAAALDNALLLARAEALSVTDDLTQLYNSRYLNEALRRETKRAIASGRPLSLLFIDLDGFKPINDTHGHLLRQPRARRGGGDHPRQRPRNRRRRPVRRRRVRDRPAGNRCGRRPGRRASASATASRRTCFWPTDGLDHPSDRLDRRGDAARCRRSAEGLLQAADAAMYRVKDRGKNGIQVGRPSGR